MRPRWVAPAASLLLLIIGFRAFAAEPVSLPPFKLGINAQIVSAGFELIPKPTGDNQLNKLKYRPAESIYTGVILGYKWLGGTVSFAVPAERATRDLEGESQYQDYRLSYYTRRFGGEIAFSRYVGYLIENSGSLSPATLNGSAYYKLPDLSTVGYGANLFYVFNPKKYSLPAALDQTDIQEVSGGSLLAVGTWREQKLSSAYTVIPDEKKALFGSDQNLKAAWASTYAGGLGFSYNWVPAFFFMSALAAVTVGYQDVNYSRSEGEKYFSSVGANAHIRYAVGINSRKFFLTASAYFDYFTQIVESLQIGNNVYGLTVATGVRF